MSLLATNPAWDEIESALEANGGELTPDIEAMMHDAEATDRQRVDAMIRCAKNRAAEAVEYEAKAKPFQAEADRWKRKKKEADGKAAFWRGRIGQTLRRLREDSLETEAGRASVYEGAWAADYDGDAGDLPEEFRKPAEFSKQAAIDAAKAGRELPPGVTVRRVDSVRLS